MKTFLYTVNIGFRIEAEGKKDANLKAEEFIRTLKSASRPRIVDCEELKFKINPEDKDDI